MDPTHDQLWGQCRRSCFAKMWTPLTHMHMLLICLLHIFPSHKLRAPQKCGRSFNIGLQFSLLGLRPISLLGLRPISLLGLRPISVLGVDVLNVYCTFYLKILTFINVFCLPEILNKHANPTEKSWQYCCVLRCESEKDTDINHIVTA